MNRSYDLSIGQRIGAGFGLLLVGLGAFTGALFIWNTRSAQAQERVVQQIAPLVDEASTLERSLMQVAIGMRSYLLDRDAVRLSSYREHSHRASESLHRLSRLATDASDESVFHELTVRVQPYLGASDRFIEASADSPVAPDDYANLVGLRERALQGVRRFADAQEQKIRAARIDMTETRDMVTDGLVTTSLLAAALFLAVGYFATQSVRRPTRQLLRVAAALESGDWRPALGLAPPVPGHGSPSSHPPRDEMRQLASAIGSVAVALERRERRLRADGRVAQATASTLEKEAIAATALPAIVECVQAEIGAIYVRDPDSDMLHAIARHALDSELCAIRVGEGVPGQAALDRRAVIVRDIPPASAFSIKLGYDKAPPRVVAAVPICFAATVHGVLLVASLRDLDDEALHFLSGAASQLGIALQNVAAYEYVQHLLTELRDRNQQIQAQNEELQAQNEEIQAQSEEIQAQSEEIQAQTQELRTHSEALAEADERKNHFLGVLAHELRNPMAPIMNSLVILKRTAVGSEQAIRAQAVIERQARHLTRLIDDLLDVTRISQGKIRIQCERLDLAEIVRSCAEDQRAAVERGGLTLSLLTPASAVWVEGDYTRLCQVLGNLVSNAVKFTDAGGRVSLALHADNGAGQAVIRVADDGIGMEADLIPRLFQPFSQSATSIARTSGGLGLGLALVKALVALHEGIVEARSDGPGRGSAFIIRLPLKRVDAATAVVKALPVHASWRVLLIEDNVDAAQSLGEVIQLDGHSVDIAHSGIEGLEKARTLRPDLVLCDIGLPMLDGYELARRIRSDPELSATFLVALTGYAAEIDRERAASAGFDLHLAKPLSPEQLGEILRELSSYRARAGLGSASGPLGAAVARSADAHEPEES